MLPSSFNSISVLVEGITFDSSMCLTDAYYCEVTFTHDYWYTTDALLPDESGKSVKWATAMPLGRRFRADTGSAAFDGSIQVDVYQRTEAGNAYVATGSVTLSDVPVQAKDADDLFHQGSLELQSAGEDADGARVGELAFAVALVPDVEEGSESSYDDVLAPLYANALDRVLLPVEEAHAAVDAIIARHAETGVRFVDGVFQPGPSSANRLPADERVHSAERAVSIRARDFMDKPSLYDDGIAPADARQGSIGDCWLIGGIGSVAVYPELIKDALYPKEYNEAGVYAVRLFRRGVWHAVILDDYFFVSGYSRKPTFMKSSSDNEIWSILLEKAFAKVFGSYQGLLPTCSMNIEPLSALTGGVCQHYISENPDDKFEMVKKYCDSHWPVGTSGSSGKGDGVVCGHAYSVLAYAEVGDVRLIRLRNTWGQHEWNGDWSDESPLWDAHPEVRDAVELKAEDDGEFWISPEDMTKHFAGLDLCRLDGERDPGTRLLDAKFCWSDTYADYAGSDQFRMVTQVGGSWGPPECINAGGELELWGSSQFKLEVDEDLHVRATLNRHTTRLMPAAHFIPNSGRRESSVSKDAVAFRTYPWFTDCTLKASESPYTVVPHAYMKGVSAAEAGFTLIIKANKKLALEPIAPSEATIVEGEWTEDTVTGMLEPGGPQYRVTLTRDAKLSVMQTHMADMDMFNPVEHGFALYKGSEYLEDPACPEDGDDIAVPDCEFTHVRCSADLSAGQYLIIPFIDDDCYSPYRIAVWCDDGPAPEVLLLTA